MNERVSPDAYGVLIEPATLKIQRRLPGPIERVWAYLTESDLRRQWLASGDMPAEVGGSVELVWRNDELTDPPGAKPDGFGDEHKMECRITQFDPPRRLAYTFGSAGHVYFSLDPAGDAVLLTLVHERLPNRDVTLKVGAGWHAHLDVLEARLLDAAPAPFWDGWSRLKTEYEGRIPT